MIVRAYFAQCDRCHSRIVAHGASEADAREIARQSGWTSWPKIQAKGPPKREHVCPECQEKVAVNQRSRAEEHRKLIDDAVRKATDAADDAAEKSFAMTHPTHKSGRKP